MKIDRQNYELYAIDFLDGKMTPSETAAFMAFLVENPDLANEIEMLRDIDTEILPKQQCLNFTHLMKDINLVKITPKNFDEFCIAYHEGELEEPVRNKLFNFIAFDIARKNKFELYGKLKLFPNKKIIYSGKNSLKQRTIIPLNPRQTAFIISFAAVACLALIFILRIPSVNQLSDSYAQPFQDSEINTKVKQLPMQDSNYSPVSNDQPENRPIQSHNSKAADYILEEFLPTIEEEVHVAVTDSGETETIRISRIEARPIHNELKTNTYDFLRSVPIRSSTNEIVHKPSINEIKDLTSRFLSLPSELTVDDLINSGIKGVNKMVEGNLSYRATRNEDGKITEFALSSDEFKYKRKIRTN